MVSGKLEDLEKDSGCHNQWWITVQYHLCGSISYFLRATFFFTLIVALVFFLTSKYMDGMVAKDGQ